MLQAQQKREGKPVWIAVRKLERVRHAIQTLAKRMPCEHKGGGWSLVTEFRPALARSKIVRVRPEAKWIEVRPAFITRYANNLIPSAPN